MRTDGTGDRDSPGPPVTRATVRSDVAALPPVDRPRLVGRAREAAVLARAFAERPAMVLVEGEAGVGKTRLVEEFLDSRPQLRRSCLVTGCLPLREPFTLGPVVDAIRQSGVDVGALPLSGLAGALRPLFPEWNATLPTAPEPLADARAARHQLFRALAELLTCLDVTLLVVEDVHWADEATLEFLLFLLAARPTWMSLVATYRPEDVAADSLLLRLLSRPPAGVRPVRVQLRPLDVTQAGELVSSMLGGEHVSAGLAEFLHSRTAGLPLVLEESVLLMRDREDLIIENGRWLRRQMVELDVPPTVRDTVLERAGRFTPDTRAVLHAVAVLATQSTADTLAAVCQLPEERVTAGLTEALGSGLVREDPVGLLSFRHRLAARAVYQAIPAPQRRALHLRAGRVLEHLTPQPLARLVHHFRNAGDTENWARYAELAADHSRATFDPATASTLLLDLLNNADLPAPSVIRLVTKVPFASLTGADVIGELIGVLRRVLAAAPLPPSVEARGRFVLGAMLSIIDDHPAANAELELALPLLPEGSTEAVMTMIVFGRPRVSLGPAAAHLAWLRRAGELTLSLPPADRLKATVERMSALLNLGEEEGWAVAAEIPEEIPAGLTHPVTCAHLNIGAYAIMWGRYAEAAARLSRAGAMAQRYQHLDYQHRIACTQVCLDWATGRWEGLSARADALAGDEDMHRMVQIEATLVMGLLQIADGAHADAEANLRTVLTEATGRGELQHQIESAAALGRLWTAAGRIDEALAVTGTAMDVVSGKGIWLWATEIAPPRVAALLAAGHTEPATELVGRFTRGLRGRDMPAPRAALALCRALVTAQEGDHVRAAAAFARAAAAWRGLPRPYDALLADEQRADQLLRARRPEAALSLLATVFEGLSTMGARGDTVRVMRTLRQHGIEVKRPAWLGGRRAYGDQLSPSELDVVRLVVTGRTNRQIGQALSRSPKTVAFQLNSAMRKLGVSSRTALAVTVLESSLVADDSDSHGGHGGHGATAH